MLPRACGSGSHGEGMGVSGFLRNIARRAAGLQAESMIAPSLPPAILLEPPASTEPASALPAEVPAAPAVPAAPPTVSAVPAAAVASPSTAPPATAPVVQRRAEAPVPVAVPAPPPAAPMAAPEPLNPTTSHASTVPGLQSPLPVPIPIEHPTPAAVPLKADSQSTMIFEPPHPAAASHPVTIEKQTIIERGSIAEPRPPTPIVPPAPVPVTLPIEHARTVSDPVVPAAVEKITHETGLQKIIERIYATEPAPLTGSEQIAKPSKKEAEPGRGVQPRLIEPSQPVPRTLAPQPRVESPKRIAAAIEAVAPEKRTVNVRIGALELKLSSPAEPAPATPPQAAGFEGFDDIRSYRY